MDEKIKFHISSEEMHRLNLKYDVSSMEKNGLNYNEMLALAASFDDCQDLEPGDLVWAKLTGDSIIFNFIYVFRFSSNITCLRLPVCLNYECEGLKFDNSLLPFILSCLIVNVLLACNKLSFLLIIIDSKYSLSFVSLIRAFHLLESNYSGIPF